MKNTIFMLLLLSLLASCQTQKTTDVKTKKTPIENKQFPKDFLGIYKGTLHILSSGKKQEIPMEYHLLKTDTADVYTYKLVYNGQARDYLLKTKNKEKGIYEVDEQNGIILPTYLNGNTLHSFFEVQGNLLTSRAQFSGNQLHFEILFSPMKYKIKSGGENVSEVFGYPISTFQKAILTKQ